ncbi:MAG: IS21 family transposase [Epsilonproteobacteria bacterium]|nr:IS21 family transposase [Campylobacterota bacterium]
MISKEEYMMIHTLKAKGYSIRAIARMTGLDRRTVSRRLKESSLKGYKKREFVSKLDPFKPYIDRRIKEALPDVLPATVIYEEIVSQGFEGSLRIVQRYLRTLTARPATEPVIRFETKPGYQAQVDWTVMRGGKHPVYAFVMVLGYSRMAYVHFTDNMRQSTWQQCHEKAFAYFGGVPQTVLYDNLKSVVVQRDRYGKGLHGFNDAFLDFSKGWFIPKLCRPYRAQTKGKVERFNRYLKESFYIPLKTSLKGSGITMDASLLNSHLHRWLERANGRVHATTKERPVDRFHKEEKARLKAWHMLPARPMEENTPFVSSVSSFPSDIAYATKLEDYERILESGHACA